MSTGSGSSESERRAADGGGQREPTPIAVAVVQYEGKFLVGQRALDVPLPGLSEFPGGKVEPGETPEEAAARECREEAGLDVLVGEAYPGASHQYDHDRLRLYFFACRPRVADQAHSLKSPFRWVTGEELAILDFPPANRALLAYLTRK